ncbi:Uncharacterised protein [Escherichia coli]|nr:Uncharacterised protein [Escherichia coli]
MALTGDPVGQFGYSNQTFSYMAIFQGVYFIHSFQLNVLEKE